MEVIISMHRNGQTRTVELVFGKENGWLGFVSSPESNISYSFIEKINLLINVFSEGLVCK